MSKANEVQPGGHHYGPGPGSYQHWDFVEAAQLDWCGANATKYAARWWKKGTPVLDLQKIIHYLQKRTEQGHHSRVGGSGMPYSRTTAMAALRRWLDADPGVPEYEQGILTQIVLGNNEAAIVLTQKLLDHEVSVLGSTE